jgi:hypothetical protein
MPSLKIRSLAGVLLGLFALTVVENAVAERRRGVIACSPTIVLYALAGLIGWAHSPKLALLIFLLLPIFYGITSEGLTETRIGLLHRANRGHRR